MGGISARNFVIQFFLLNTLDRAKLSKTFITLEGKHMGPYPFECLLVSSGPNYLWSQHQNKSCASFRKVLSSAKKEVVLISSCPQRILS